MIWIQPWGGQSNLADLDYISNMMINFSKILCLRRQDSVDGLFANPPRLSCRIASAVDAVFCLTKKLFQRLEVGGVGFFASRNGVRLGPPNVFHVKRNRAVEFVDLEFAEELFADAAFA